MSCMHGLVGQSFTTLTQNLLQNLYWREYLLVRREVRESRECASGLGTERFRPVVFLE